MDDYRITDSFDKPAKVILREGVTEDDLYPEKPFKTRIKEAFSKKGAEKFIKNSFPRKGDSTKEKIRKIIMDVSFVLFIGTLIYLFVYYGNYRSRVSDTATIIQIIDKYSDLKGPELEKAWADVKKQYPDVDFPEGMNIGFAELYAVNPDLAGRLTIPGTNIDTVFMQTTNNSYYLYKDFYGKQSRYGMPFANYSCSVGADGLSKNTIIYGHNTHDGLMFHQLIKYMTVDGYRAAPVIRLDTLYDTTYWKIFGVILTNATTDLDNGRVFNCLYSEYTSDAEFMNIISGINTRSIISTGVDVKSGDKIISLYTCYQDIFKGGRLIVFGKLLREGETKDVDTDGAYYNSGAKYPQAYYDAMGLDNPYYLPPLTTEQDPSQTVEEAGGETPSGEESSVESTPEEAEESVTVQESAVPDEVTQTQATTPENAPSPAAE